MSHVPRIPRDAEDDYGPAIVEERRSLAEETAGRPLPYLRGEEVPAAQARGNIENFVGYAQVPVGLAGPLHVDTSDGELQVLVPFATTEGAMVASYSRGMSLLRAGGPVRARVIHEGLTQNPVFVFDRAEQAITAAQEIRTFLPDLQEITAGLTRHGRLTSADPEVVGRRVIVRFEFTTGDAIGINMAAHATERCAAEIARRVEAAQRYVHGQDVEKRANARALIEGRGRVVVADGIVPRQTLIDRARATPEDLVRIIETYRVGYAQLGTHNWLVQTANGIAGLYLACGQDVAYVTESCNGQLDFAVTSDGDLHATAHLPSILVGTVGGGSSQGTAAECLSILGCVGAGKANRFAEIVGAAMLAGDLSLMAAFCSHEFVEAHERLGRNRPDSGGGGDA